MHRLDYLLYTYGIISWFEIAKEAMFLQTNELSRYLFSFGIFGRAAFYSKYALLPAQQCF